MRGMWAVIGCTRSSLMMEVTRCLTCNLQTVRKHHRACILDSRTTGPEPGLAPARPELCNWFWWIPALQFKDRRRLRFFLHMDFLLVHVLGGEGSSAGLVFVQHLVQLQQQEKFCLKYSRLHARTWRLIHVWSFQDVWRVSEIQELKSESGPAEKRNSVSAQICELKWLLCFIYRRLIFDFIWFIKATKEEEELLFDLEPQTFRAVWIRPIITSVNHLVTLFPVCARTWKMTLCGCWSRFWSDGDRWEENSWMWTSRIRL